MRQGQLVRSLVAVHHAALAVNPQERLVATLVSQADAYRAGLTPWDAAYPVFCLVEDLDLCTLDDHGLVTPALMRVRAMRAAAAAAEQAAATERARLQALWNSADAAIAATQRSHGSNAADPREAEFHRHGVPTTTLRNPTVSVSRRGRETPAGRDIACGQLRSLEADSCCLQGFRL